MQSHENLDGRPYGTEPSTVDTAKDQAKQVGGQAVEQAKDVAANAGERAQDLAQTAKAEAADVKDTAVAVGSDVIDSAKQQAGEVVDEVKLNAQHLMEQGLTELKQQAGTGQNKLAEIVRSFTGELDSMVKAGNDGPATQLVGQAHGIADQVAAWLENKGPEDVVADVRRYAARNPFAFMAIAAGVGFVGARVVRGIQAANEPQLPATQRRELTGPAVPAQPVQPRRELVETTEVTTEVAPQTHTPAWNAPEQPVLPGRTIDPVIPAQTTEPMPYGTQPGEGSNSPYAQRPAQDTNPGYGTQQPYGQTGYGDDRR